MAEKEKDAELIRKKQVHVCAMVLAFCEYYTEETIKEIVNELGIDESKVECIFQSALMETISQTMIGVPMKIEAEYEDISGIKKNYLDIIGDMISRTTSIVKEKMTKGEKEDGR